MKIAKIPWPEAGDQPLKTEAVGPGFYRTFVDRWTAYAESYKRVADAAVRLHLRERRPDATVMYPVAFMYRHYVELQLKNIIRLGHALHGRHDTVPMTHRLDQLWRQARATLREVWPKGDAETLDAAEGCIKDFERMDPNSVAFRYAAGADGREYLEDVDALDLRHLSKVMNKLGTFFESCIGAMDMYFDAMNQANHQQ